MQLMRTEAFLILCHLALGAVFAAIYHSSRIKPITSATE